MTVLHGNNVKSHSHTSVKCNPFNSQKETKRNIFQTQNRNVKLKRCMITMHGSNNAFYILVQLKDLWKIKAPLGTVEGFNVQAFDELIQVRFIRVFISHCSVHSGNFLNSVIIFILFTKARCMYHSSCLTLL